MFATYPFSAAPYSAVGAVPIWSGIAPTQSPAYAEIVPTQNPGYNEIVPSQDPNWVWKDKPS